MMQRTLFRNSVNYLITTGMLLISSCNGEATKTSEEVRLGVNTEARFHFPVIRVGDKYTDVIRRAGNPTALGRPYTDGGSFLLIYELPRAEGTVFVNVTGTSSESIVLFVCSRKSGGTNYGQITQAQAESITVGMSCAEMLDRLGPPLDLQGSGISIIIYGIEHQNISIAYGANGFATTSTVFALPPAGWQKQLKADVGG